MDYIKIGAEPVAQGELLILRVASLPDTGLTPMEAEGGNFVIGHSETGHHHIVKKQKGVEAYVTNDNSVLFLKVLSGTKEPVLLEHLRAHDTHKTFAFKAPDEKEKTSKTDKPDFFIIRRQQESFLEGFRPALD